MANKICIFVKGASNRGKSKAIIALAKLLGVSLDSPMWINGGAEVRGITNFKDKKVALCSNGDPGCHSVEWVRQMAIQQEKCDVIVVACRRGGNTQDPLLPDLKNGTYEVIEAYPFRKPNSSYSHQEECLLSGALAISIMQLI